MKLYLKDTAKLAAKYTFPKELEDNTSENWQGWQRGVLAFQCSITKDGTLIRASYVENDTDDGTYKNAECLLNAYEADEVELIKERHTIIKGNDLVDELWYFVPYIPENHKNPPETVYRPVMGASNTINKVTVELVLADKDDDDLRSYQTISFSSRNIGILEMLKDSLEDSLIDLEDIETQDDLPKELKQLGIYISKDEDTEEPILFMDFYDPIGEKYPIEIRSDEDIWDMIVSMRVIKNDLIID